MPAPTLHTPAIPVISVDASGSPMQSTNGYGKLVLTSQDGISPGIFSAGDGYGNADYGLFVISRGAVYNGNSWDRQRGDVNGTYMTGNVASGTTDAGNGVKVSGVFNTTTPTFTDGNRADVQLDNRGNVKVALTIGANALGASADNADAVAVTTTANRLFVFARNSYFNGTSWDRQKGDVTGAWSHAPANTASTALSGTIAATGATATIAFTNTTRQELHNPSTAILWASWGATPAVNGAGSFQIAPGGTFTTDRTAGTLTLLSTVASQPFTVNRYS
jgi:hypothetical protein